MKIKYLTGCIHNSLTINGIEASNMDIKELKSIVKELVDKDNDLGSLQQIIIDYICQLGTSNEKDWYKCDCCNDIVETWEFDYNSSFDLYYGDDNSRPD